MSFQGSFQQMKVGQEVLLAPRAPEDRTEFTALLQVFSFFFISSQMLNTGRVNRKHMPFPYKEISWCYLILSLTYHWPALGYMVMLNYRVDLELKSQNWYSIIKLKVENECWEVLINLCHSIWNSQLVSIRTLSIMAATNHIELLGR